MAYTGGPRYSGTAPPPKLHPLPACPSSVCAQDAAHKTCHKRQSFLGGFLTKQTLATREKHAKCIGEFGGLGGWRGFYRGESGLIEKSIVEGPPHSLTKLA